MNDTQWLLLVYKIPREPTAGRVYVWRKLKQLGAIAMQDAAWVLPLTPRTREQFQWLAAEVSELGGEASVFTAQVLLDGQQQSLRKQFEAPVNESYRELLAELQRRHPDLAVISKRYQQAKAQDYFQSPLGEKVRQKLLAKKGGAS